MELYADGRYQPLDRPVLPARDRGFLYGEAVYEGVKLTGRRPLFLEAHLERLAASAASLGITVPWDVPSLRAVLGRLVETGGPADGVARLYLTAGVGEGGAGALAWIEPLPDGSRPGADPWRLVCHPERIVPYRPSVKHVNRLPHAIARRQARAAGADDALLVHVDGWVLEGTASNLFFFEADTLHTPETGCGLLAGITREILLELAPGCGFKTVEGRYPAEVVAASDECFLSYTSAGIKPVAALDGQALPAPVPGPRTARLRAAYDAHVAAALAATPPL